MSVLMIGKDKFEITLMPAWDSFLLQPRILPVLPDLAQLYAMFFSQAAELLAAGVDPTKMEMELGDLLATSGKMIEPSLEKASVILERMCKKLPPRELDDICRGSDGRAGLLAGATINGMPLLDVFNAAMRGRVLDTWKVIVHAVKENFPDFFAMLDGRGVSAAPASPSVESSTSSPSGPASG